MQSPTSASAKPHFALPPKLDTLPVMESAEAAKEFYDAYGVVVVKLLDAAQCDRLILEQWTKVIQTQPWSYQYKVRVPHDPVHQPQEFLRTVKSPLSPKMRNQFKEGWCLHRGFGACCDPVVFHLPEVWEVRQDPKLYDLARQLTGVSELWVTIERSIQKLPGEGEDEFLHWDLDPLNIDDEHTESKHVCGKVCYTASRFVCVPGTHTADFFKVFRDQYAQHYANIKAGTPKFAIDFAKPDPLDLVGHGKAYVIPAGCIVMWNDRLLHGQAKTPLSHPIEYGCYVGFRPAVANAKYRIASGIHELEDRLNSYYNGVAPQLWPSLDRVQFYPKRFQNFPKLLQGYIDKMPKGHPSIAERVTAKNKTVAHLIPWRDGAYVPPVLSSLGRKLLGTDEWSVASSAAPQPVPPPPPPPLPRKRQRVVLQPQDMDSCICLLD